MSASYADSSSKVSELSDLVHLKLCQCLVRLVQYEMLVKHIIRNEFTPGQPPLPAKPIEKRALSASGTTGRLSNILSKSFATSKERLAKGCGAPMRVVDCADASTKIHSKNLFDSEYYFEIKKGFNELAILREELTHNFRKKFNLSQATGCNAAKTFLNSTYGRIDAHYVALQLCCASMVDSQSVLRFVLQSAALHAQIIEGISFEGLVDWPRSGIVQGLRDAEADLAIDGWVSLSTAVDWLNANAPDQVPSRYGCDSWEQVLDESGQFEFCKLPATALPVNNEISDLQMWYRSRRSPGPNYQGSQI